MIDRINTIIIIIIIISSIIVIIIIIIIIPSARRCPRRTAGPGYSAEGGAVDRACSGLGWYYIVN